MVRSSVLQSVVRIEQRRSLRLFSFVRAALSDQLINSRQGTTLPSLVIQTTHSLSPPLNYNAGDNGITDFAILCPNDINDIIVQSGDNIIIDFAICQVVRNP